MAKPTKHIKRKRKVARNPQSHVGLDGKGANEIRLLLRSLSHRRVFSTEKSFFDEISRNHFLQGKL